MTRPATRLELYLAKSLAHMALAGLKTADAKFIVEEAGLTWEGEWEKTWNHCVELAAAGKPTGDA